MDALLPTGTAGVFDAKAIQAMFFACEEVCKALHINGNAEARAAIARRIVKLAGFGGRDPTVLGDRVLAEANVEAAQVGDVLIRLSSTS